MTDSRNTLFSEAPVWKAVLSLAVPTVISQLITVVYNMADTFFIGQMNDPIQVAATTIAMPCYVFMNAFSNLFGLGGASLISRCLGMGDTSKARHTAAFCIWTGVCVSFLYGILIYFLEPVLFPILGATSETWEYLRRYVFWTTVVGAVPTVMNTELAHLIRSEGYAKNAGFGVALGGILNIILDPIFIFTLGLNLTGAAVATMLSNVAASVYFIIFLLRIRKHSVITLNPKEYSVRQGIPAEVLSVGFPGFVMTLMSTISNMSLNHMVAGYSSTAIAGMGIAKKIDILAFAIAQGMTQGTLPLIGYNYSAGRIKRMKKSIFTALLYSMVVAVCGMLLLYFGASHIVKGFISNEETVAYGENYLKILSLACPTTAVNFMAITVFQAIGKKVQPFILSLMRKGSIDVLLMLLLNRLIGISGIAWATPIADWIAFVVSMFLIIIYFRKINLHETDAVS